MSYLYWKNYFKIFVVGSNGYLKLEGYQNGEEQNLYMVKENCLLKTLYKSYNFKEKDFTWSREIKILLKNNFLD